MAEDNAEKSKNKTKKSKKLSKKQWVRVAIVAGALLLIGAVSLSIYSYLQLQSVKKNPQKVIQGETKTLLDEISRHIDIPRDEDPTVATVNDKDKLKDQPFFSNARNGDKVVIFAKAKKAIIYRESEDKLINVGPLNIEGGQVGVGVLGAGGNVQTAQKAITDKLGSSVVISFSGDAKSKTEVSKTTVVDVSGQNGDTAKQIAQLLGGDVSGQLPSGETAPANTAIVVIYK